MNLKDKKVLVYGSGLSGIGAANLLEKVGAYPVIFDEKESISKPDILDKLADGSKSSVILGTVSEKVMDSLDLVVLSPGVPTDLPVMDRFREKNIPLWGEVELAYQMGQGRILAITGTNGKTTTTALLGQIMKDYAESVYVVGNIGTPYTSVALEMRPDTYTVAEISSFQLETTCDFHPDVSAILNITEDHLNRHHTMQEYIRVKELITANQTECDTCVLNYEDEVLQSFGKTLKEKVLFFSSARKLERGIFLDGEDMVLQTEEWIPVVNVKELKLIGLHNYENVMAAVAMAYSIGVPMESIRKTICAFKAVEHRIEYVDEKKGVVYYNDSKGTNPDAAIKAIQAMNRPTLLIGGGYDKNSDYKEWIQSFAGKVRYLVLIGATREKIAEEARECGFKDIVLKDNMIEALDFCVEYANPGDAVLLSPACASWGEFDNYEQRGDRFKEYVSNLGE